MTLAKTLAPALAPTLSTLHRPHAEQLIELWDKIRDDPTLRDPRPGADHGRPAARGRRCQRLEFYTCVEMIQLMENVYLDLQLEETWDHADNHGWRKLFTRWAAAAAQGDVEGDRRAVRRAVPLLRPPLAGIAGRERH